MHHIEPVVLVFIAAAILIAVVLFSWIIFAYRIGSITVLVGTRSLSVFLKEEEMEKAGFTLLSVDKYRDSQYREKGKWNNTQAQIFFFAAILKNVFFTQKVVVSTSANSYRYFWFLSLFAYDFEVIDKRQYKPFAIFGWRAMSNYMAGKIAPKYFGYDPGSVMLKELEGYDDSLFSGTELNWINKKRRFFVLG